MDHEKKHRPPVIIVGEGGQFIHVDPKDRDVIDVTPTEVRDHVLLGEPVRPGEEIILPRPRVHSEQPLLPEKSRVGVEESS